VPNLFSIPLGLNKINWRVALGPLTSIAGRLSLRDLQIKARRVELRTSVRHDRAYIDTTVCEQMG
jgi:hypothetical protein